MIIEIFKTFILGIVEGITEWLPISSTGHMLLVDEFIKLEVRPEFMDMFLYVIQLGAILAVVLLFWDKMWPFNFRDKSQPVIKKDIFTVWFKVVVACIPGAIATFLFDEWFEKNLQTPTVIAIALIFYGIIFIVIENWNKKRTPTTLGMQDITYKTAFIIGLFQVLSVVPGTSRSGSTIIGALTVGVSRVAAAEFTFFLAVPVMIGMSLIKIAKFVLDGFTMNSSEIIILAVGCITAFVTSIVVIKFLMSYIKKKDFKVFGWYRIILGAIVLLYFLVIK